MYKESKAFKGFEVIYHQLQMNFKMYLYTFIVVLLIHLAIVALYLVMFQFRIVELALTAVFNFYVEYWPRVAKVVFLKSLPAFVFTSPVWLIYPKLLKRFKQKSEEIVQDRHMRGSKLISDDELQRIVIEDIKNGRRF